MNHGRLEHHCEAPASEGHRLFVVLSGAITVRSTRGESSGGPGEFLLVREDGFVAFTVNQPTDFLVLSNPIREWSALLRFAKGEVYRFASHGEQARLLATWSKDIVSLDRLSSPNSLLASIGRVLADLSVAVVSEPPKVAKHKLDRTFIELAIARNLESESFSIQHLAGLLGCSVRTLHRIFSREEGESLERFIQHKRVELCAAQLRDPTRVQAPSLTDLAMKFGFASSSHFCTVFRSHFGVPPSIYRRQCVSSPEVMPDRAPVDQVMSAVAMRHWAFVELDWGVDYRVSANGLQDPAAPWSDEPAGPPQPGTGGSEGVW